MSWLKNHRYYSDYFLPIASVCLLSYTIGALGCTDNHTSTQIPDVNKADPLLDPSLSPTPLAITAVTPSTNMELPYPTDFPLFISIIGSNFEANTRVLINGNQITVQYISDHELHMSYEQLLGLNNTSGQTLNGPLDIRVINPDGTEVILEKAFFLFSQTQWSKPARFPAGAGQSMLVSDNTIYLGTSNGNFFYEEEYWNRLEPQSSFLGEAPCGPESVISGLCIGPHSAMHIEHLESADTLYVRAQSSALLVSHNNAPLEILSSFQEKVLALDSQGESIYVLTTAGIFSKQANEDWVVVILWPGWLEGYITEPLSGRSVAFAAHQIEDIYHFFVQTDLGLLHLFKRSADSAEKEPSGYSEIGCCHDNESFCFCEHQLISLDIDHNRHILYIAWPEENEYIATELDRIVSVDMSILPPHAENPSSPINGNTVARLPSIKSILAMDDDLLVISTTESDSVHHGSDQIYKIENMDRVGMLSIDKTFGLPPLSTVIPEEIDAIDYKEGTFYAFLHNRPCLLVADEVPLIGRSQSAHCLGEEFDLADQEIKYLFLTDSGDLATATQDGTFVFDEITSQWNPSSVTAQLNLRMDLDFSAVTHREGLPSSLITCTLSIPEDDLTFVCTQDGTYVSFNDGDWHRIFGPSLPKGKIAAIQSLAYSKEFHTLYGAATGHGLFALNLP